MEGKIVRQHKIIKKKMLRRNLYANKPDIKISFSVDRH